jgi:hypothetical protein
VATSVKSLGVGAGVAIHLIVAAYEKNALALDGNSLGQGCCTSAV